MKLLLHVPAQAGVKKVLKVNYSTFDACIFDCDNPESAVEFLKKRKKTCKIIAKLPQPDERSFAYLYDFVDAFIISGFAPELETKIDPLLNLRLFNDEYKEIFLDIPGDMLIRDLDELLSYSMLSNIDGIVLGRPRLLQYTADRSKGILQIFADDVNSEEELSRASADGASAVAVKSGKYICKASRIGKRLRKLLTVKDS